MAEVWDSVASDIPKQPDSKILWLWTLLFHVMLQMHNGFYQETYYQYTFINIKNIWV